MTCIIDGWRKDFLVEHQGEYKDVQPGCPGKSHQDLNVGVQYKIIPKAQMIYSTDCNIISSIFPGAKGQGHVTWGHEKSACGCCRQFSKNGIKI